ncbi:MAG: SurA N-terminal domain-containing protein [Thermodesulfobacteriota bacterium]
MRLVRLGRFIGVLIFAVLTLLPAASGAEVVDRVVAVINDSIITLSELNAAAAIVGDKLKKEGEAEAPGIEELRPRVLEDLVEQKLVKQASDKAGIDVSDREIDNAIDDIKRQNRHMNQEQLMLALARSGLTYREYREQLKEQIREVKFMNMEFRSKISVQDEDIENYYRQNIDDYYEAPKYRISCIVISPDDRSLMGKKIEVVREGLAEGRDFAELARLYSDGPNAGGGGDLGRLRSGELDPEIERTALALGPGQVSEPLERPEGTYIIKLNEGLRADPIPLERVRGVIREMLFSKAMEDRFNFWLGEQKKQAHIEIRF